MKYIMNATMRDSTYYYIRLCILLYKGLYYVYIPYVYNTRVAPIYTIYYVYGAIILTRLNMAYLFLNY